MRPRCCLCSTKKRHRRLCQRQVLLPRQSATADMPVDVPQARRGDKKLSIFEVKKEALEAKKSQEEAAETLQRFLRFRWVTKSEKTAAETPLPAYTRASKGLAELKALGQCKKIDCPDLKVETLHRKNPAFHDKSCAYSDCDKCGLTEEFSVALIEVFSEIFEVFRRRVEEQSLNSPVRFFTSEGHDRYRVERELS